MTPTENEVSFCNRTKQRRGLESYLTALIVEVLRDEAVQFLSVLWQLEQRTNTQEVASRLTLLHKDLKNNECKFSNVGGHSNNSPFFVW